MVDAGAPAILIACSPYCHGTTVKQGLEPTELLSVIFSLVQAVVSVFLRPV